MFSGRMAKRALRSLWCHNSWIVRLKKKCFTALFHETDHLFDSLLPRAAFFVLFKEGFFLMFDRCMYKVYKCSSALSS